MARKEYHKLVRDKIPEIIRKHGEKAIMHTASNDEYWLALLSKLQEEIQEFIAADGPLEELADIMEVLEAIIEFRKIDRGALAQVQATKKNARGGFTQKIILEATE